MEIFAGRVNGKDYTEALIHAFLDEHPDLQISLWPEPTEYKIKILLRNRDNKEIAATGEIDTASFLQSPVVLEKTLSETYEKYKLEAEKANSQNLQFSK